MRNYTDPITVTGNPVSFSAPNGATVLNLSVPFSPVQDLHGYSKPWAAGAGKNMIGYMRTRETAGITFTYSADGSVTFDGTATSNAFQDLTGQYANYTLYPAGSYKVTGATGESDYYLACVVMGTDGSLIDDIYPITENQTITLASPAHIIPRYVVNKPTHVENLTFWPMIREASIADDTWEPYENECPITGRTGANIYVSSTYNVADATTFTVDWTSVAGTVYGGTLAPVTGALSSTMANIASYNGETIGEPWLSSLDEYSTGATPTTGAQVVYTLTTPVDYQLTPKIINLLKGTNYVWSDIGTVTLIYALLIFVRQKLIVNGVDLTPYVERDSYRTSLSPVYSETINTLDGIGHTALLRLKGALRIGLNPQTDSDTATVCTTLLNSPCQVVYHCLQRDADVSALMKVDTLSAQFLSRCLYLGDEWNEIEEITLTEL